jgi:hypothetical protein
MSPHTAQAQPLASHELRAAHVRALAQAEFDGLEPWRNRKALADVAAELAAAPRNQYPAPTMELYSGSWVHFDHPAVNTVLDVAVNLAEDRILEVRNRLRRMTRTQLEAALIAAARTIPLDAPASLLWPCPEDRG